jgi:hypothetical protein
MGLFGWSSKKKEAEGVVRSCREVLVRILALAPEDQFLGASIRASIDSFFDEDGPESLKGLESSARFWSFVSWMDETDEIVFLESFATKLMGLSNKFAKMGPSVSGARHGLALLGGYVMVVSVVRSGLGGDEAVKIRDNYEKIFPLIYPLPAENPT